MPACKHSEYPSDHSVHLRINLKNLTWLILMLKCFTGNAQVLLCDPAINQPLCPSTKTTCTCIVNGTYSETGWNFLTLNLCPSSYNSINLPQPDPCAPPATFSSGQCGPYLTASNYAPNKTRDDPCQTSILTITANPALNGLVLECRDYASSILGTSSGTKFINIIGKCCMTQSSI